MIVARRMLKDRRRALVWWLLSIAAVSGLMLGLYPSIEGQAGLEQTFDQLPSPIKAMMGTPGGLSIISATGYVHGRIMATFAPLLLTIFGIGLGARAVAGSESDGTLELVLANPISRRRFAAEKGAVVGSLVAVLGVAMASSVVVLCQVVGGSLADLSPVRLLASFGAAICMSLSFAAIAFAVGCVTGQRGKAVAIAAAIAVGTYLIQILTLTLPTLKWLGWLSPWGWYLKDVILMHGLNAAAVMLPLGLAAAAASLGILVFSRRDLR